MRLFFSHSTEDSHFVSCIIQRMQEGGHEVIDPFKIASFDDSTYQTISANIRSADIVIAIMTKDNPSAYFEVGLAAGVGIPTIIMASSGEHLPAILASTLYVQLTGDYHRDIQAITRRINEMASLSHTKTESYDSAEAALQEADMNPNVLEAISPIKFKRLLTEMFKDRGYNVDSSKHARSFGVDFTIRNEKGNLLALVDVKKYSIQNRVSVDAVRQLVGSTMIHKAHIGIIITSARFTSAAHAYAAEIPCIKLCTLSDIISKKSEYIFLSM